MTDCGEALLAVEIDVGDVSLSLSLLLLLLLLLPDADKSSWPFNDDRYCAFVSVLANDSELGGDDGA